jgi:hypothetical protein
MNPQEVLAPLAAGYPVVDLTVASPDFEEIVRLIYERGRPQTPAQALAARDAASEPGAPAAPATGSVT